jgi:hypothetical protein
MTSQSSGIKINKNGIGDKMKVVEYILRVGPQSTAIEVLHLAPNRFNPKSKIKEWKDNYDKENDHVVEFSHAAFDTYTINSIQIIRVREVNNEN